MLRPAGEVLPEHRRPGCTLEPFAKPFALEGGRHHRPLGAGTTSSVVNAKVVGGDNLGAARAPHPSAHRAREPVAAPRAWRRGHNGGLVIGEFGAHVDLDSVTEHLRHTDKGGSRLFLSASFDVPLEVVDMNLRIGRDKRGNAGTNLREGLSEGLQGIHLDPRRRETAPRRNADRGADGRRDEGRDSQVPDRTVHGETHSQGSHGGSAPARPAN